jgi:sec-independent protein translocase protein TatC
MAMAHEAPGERPGSGEGLLDQPPSTPEAGGEEASRGDTPDLTAADAPAAPITAGEASDPASSLSPAPSPESSAGRVTPSDSLPPCPAPADASSETSPEPAVESASSADAAAALPAPATPPPPVRPRSFTGDEDEEDEEEGGGPVKPFLDHLEDLRWTLIKVVVSILLGMLVCLVAGNRLVAFLTWPLVHAQRLLPVAQQRVPLLLGTNEVGRVQVGSVHLPPTVDSNHVTALELAPTPLGDRWVLALTVHTNRLATQPAPNLVVLKNYGPISAFMVALKIALYGGLVVSAPFVIFFIGQFVLPALKVKEKKFLYRVAGLGSVLFIAGVAFCYLVIVQVALMASVQFSQWMGFGADEWRAEDYVSFVCKFMLGMGLSFQLPLVILTLVKMGLVDHQTLAEYRSYFIVGNLTLSAVITPSGDPLTMVLMALPIQVLYEGSLLVARRWARQEREREAAEAAAGRG